MSIPHPFLKAIIKPLVTLGATASIMAALVVPAQAELVISSGSGGNISAVATSTNAQNTAYTQNNRGIGQQIVASQQTPSDASVLKLMQVMHVDQQIDAIVNGQQAVSDLLQEQGNKSTADETKLNKRQRELAKNMQGVLAQYSKILAGGVQGTATKEELTESYLAAAKAHYTQQEVNALIGFYDTSMGQSILDKNPEVTAQFIDASMPDEQQMKQTTDQLEQLMPQIKEMMNGIF